MKLVLIPLAALLLAPAGAAQLPRPAAPTAPMAPAATAAVAPEGLVRAINALREEAGVPALSTMAALQKVAQARADEMAKQKTLEQRASMALFARMERQLEQAGYRPHGWTESFTVTAGEVDKVIAYWRQRDPEPYREAMRPAFQHVGIGVARFQGVPLYTFLLAWPEAEFYRQQVTPLADLAQVRNEMLARVNRARSGVGLPPLVAEERLDQAAQAHAADMLARTFYAHRNPEGEMPRARAEKTGYRAKLIAENIAAGSLSVENALAGWLLSSGHRRNLLDPTVTQLGVGLAVGPFESRYRVLWVQVFAQPEPGPVAVAPAS